MRSSSLLLVPLLLGGCAHHRAWRSAVDSVRVTGIVELDARLDGDPAFCADVVGEMRAGAMVRCSPDGEVGVRVSLDLGRIEHQRAARQESARYVVGSEFVPNPDYPAVEAAFFAASDALARAQERLARSYGEGREGLEALVAERGRALDGARAALEDTPATLERPVHAVHSWEAVHHTWRTDFGWRASLEAAGLRTTRDGAGELTRRGVDQPGFAAAGVRGQRAARPSPQAFAEAAADRAAEGVARMLDDELDRMAAHREQICPPAPRQADDAGWLACRAEVRLLRGQKPRM